MLPNLSIRLPQVRKTRRQLTDLVYIPDVVSTEQTLVTVFEPTGEDHIFTVGLDKLQSLLRLVKHVPIVGSRHSTVLLEGIAKSYINKLVAASYYLLPSNTSSLFLTTDSVALSIQESSVTMMRSGEPIRDFIPKDNLVLKDLIFEYKKEGADDFLFWEGYRAYNRITKVVEKISAKKAKKTITFPCINIVPPSIGYSFVMPSIQGTLQSLSYINKILNNIVDVYNATPLYCRNFSTIKSYNDKYTNIRDRVVSFLDSVLPTVDLINIPGFTKLVEPVTISNGYNSIKYLKNNNITKLIDSSITPKTITEKGLDHYTIFEKYLTTLPCPVQFKIQNKEHADFINLLLYGAKMIKNSNSNLKTTDILDIHRYSVFTASLNIDEKICLGGYNIRLPKEVLENCLNSMSPSDFRTPIFYAPPKANTVVNVDTETNVDDLFNTINDIMNDKNVVSIQEANNVSQKDEAPSTEAN